MKNKNPYWTETDEIEHQKTRKAMLEMLEKIEENKRLEKETNERYTIQDEYGRLLDRTFSTIAGGGGALLLYATNFDKIKDSLPIYAPFLPEIRSNADLIAFGGLGALASICVGAVLGYVICEESIKK